MSATLADLSDTLSGQLGIAYNGVGLGEVLGVLVKEVAELVERVKGVEGGLRDAKAHAVELHEEAAGAISSHSTEIHNILAQHSAVHLEMQQTTAAALEQATATASHYTSEVETRLQTLHRHHRHALSRSLLKALSTNLRKTYFAKLLRNRDGAKALQRKHNMVARLGYRSNLCIMQWGYNTLRVHAKIARKRAVATRHLRVVCNNTSRGMMWHRFKTWRVYAKEKVKAKEDKQEANNRIVKSCMGLARLGTLRYWFGVLVKNRKLAAEKKVRVETSKMLAVTTQQGHKQVVWDRWVVYLRAHQKKLRQKKLGEKFLTFVSGGVRQGYFDKWMGYRVRQRTKKMISQKLTQLKQMKNHGLKQAAYELWVKKAMLARKRAEQRRIAGVLLRAGPQNLKRQYYAKWLKAANEAKNDKDSKRAAKAKKLAALASNKLKKQEMILAFYNMWKMFAESKRAEHRRVEAANKMLSLQQKAEALWYQMELHQKTVSNTNSCVQRLVDKMLTVDDCIDRLDKTKVNRRELQGLGILEHLTPTTTPSEGLLAHRYDDPTLPAAPPLPRITPDDVATASLSASRISVDALGYTQANINRKLPSLNPSAPRTTHMYQG